MQAINTPYRTIITLIYLKMDLSKMVNHRLPLIFILLSFLSAANAKPLEPLFFGVPPLYSIKDIESDFKPVVNYLSKSLDRQVVLVISHSYEELVDDLKTGQTDFAILGGALYVEAKDNLYPKVVYIATAQTESLGKKQSYYYSYIISHKSNPYKSVFEAKSKSFGLVSKNSTSGYKYPLSFLYKNNIFPDMFFNEVIFSGTHENLTDMIINKTIDLGATYDENLRSAERKYGNVFNIIKKLGPIANLAVVANHRMDNITKRKVQQALVNIPNDAINLKMPYKGFEVLSDKFYDPVREVSLQLSAQKERERQNLRAAIVNKSLNKVLSLFIEQKKDANEISQLIRSTMLHSSFHVKGKSGSLQKSIFYNDGWVHGENALELILDNGMIVMILNQEQLKNNEEVSFNIKIVGIFGKAIVAKVVD